MTKKSQKAEINSFVKGLITEASPLNYPPDAAVDILNFNLNRNGTLNRRLGMDFETNYDLVSTDKSVNSIVATNPVAYKWSEVGGDVNLNINVIQIGNSLVLFDLDKSTISGNPPLDTITLTGFPSDTQYTFSTESGILIVTAGVDTVGIVSYEEGVFSFSLDRLKTRDVWGVEVSDELSYETDASYRGTTFNNTHYYNLQNQSWGIPRANNTGTLRDPITYFFDDLGKYPSNSETVWIGLQFQPVAGSAAPFERVYTNLYNQTLGTGDFKTARGYFIIDLLRRGQSRVDAFTANGVKYTETFLKSISLPQDYTAGGPTVTTSFAGRIFYAGFTGTTVGGDSRSPNLSNYIFFSQLVKNKTDIVKCYQEGDPTSRENSDIVDTDGGFIKMAGAEGILAMIGLATSLIVIARNGVWSVTGGSDFGFTATNFKVTKISSYGGISRLSVVEDGSRVFYWGNNGVFLVEQDKLGDFQVVNISETSIQTYYNAIPSLSKERAQGLYDPVNKKVRWLYKTGTMFTSTSLTYELVFDTLLGAFVPYKISNDPDNNVEVVSIFQATPFTLETVQDDVVVEEDQVLSATVEVTTSVDVRNSGSNVIKYLVMVKDGVNLSYTFSLLHNTSFLDWEAYDGAGVDAPAYLVTGDQIVTDSSIHKQVPYLTIHFRRTENGVGENLVPINQSSCKVRSQWDFANSVNSNKWGRLFQAYRYRRAYLAVDEDDTYDTGHDVITSKNKLRGRGKAFALHMETDPGKDCQILGWNLAINGNSTT